MADRFGSTPWRARNGHTHAASVWDEVGCGNVEHVFEVAPVSGRAITASACLRVPVMISLRPGSFDCSAEGRIWHEGEWSI
jgi:hypothetical protein